jgi:replicative superfamily II helicase
MVDFKKRLDKFGGDKLLNPIEIYDRLDRASDKGPLRPAQVSVLEEWHNNRRTQRDIILKLNTGQGKTLTGLLMLQSMMNENEGPSLYLCPNNLLVSQTVTQAKQFGITCVVPDGDLPVEFLDGKNILVASIQKLFNGWSKFKLDQQSISVANIVVDDAHACIDSIKESYTIKFPSEHQAYRDLLDLFASALEEQGAGTYADIRNNNQSAFLPVPYWEWIDHTADVVKILSRYSKDDAVTFAWPLIKDILKDCLCIISGGSLEISPYRPPLQKFGSYYKAKHRVFMSATITDDSFLIKGLGLSEETINSPLVYQDEKWAGEKMVLIPSLISSKITTSVLVNEFAKQPLVRKAGIVVLCPSFQTTVRWDAAGAYVAKKEDIQLRVEKLRNQDYSETLVIANRYDGIDLPDDACRILIMDSKPYSQDLLERYMETCREGSQIVDLKIARTIEQGLGRSVRGEKDYSVIILTGEDLVKFVRARDSRKNFSAQTRTQIEIGFEVAKLAQEEVVVTEPVKVLKGLINQCLNRDTGWKEFYIENMNQISQPHTSPKILNIFSAEMKAEEKYYGGQYEEAANIIQKIIDSDVEIGADKGWYLQEKARYTYSSSKSSSNELQVIAHRYNRYLLRPKNGMVFSKISTISQKRIENIVKYIKEFNAFDDLTLSVDDMLGDLRFGVKADRFEKALNELAHALGFEGERPDKEWKEGPDNLWALRDSEYILFECKNEVSENRTEINKDEVGQMNTSSAWFKKNYAGTKVKRILIIPTKSLSKAAVFSDDVEIMREHSLKKLRDNVRAFFREFKNLDFADLSEGKIQSFIETHKLSISNLLEDYSEAPKVY